MKARNIFWGLFFLAAAGLIIYGQVASFTSIGLGTMLLTLLMAVIIIKSLPGLNFSGVTIPIAILYLIYQKPLELPIMNTWVLLGAALLAGIGLQFIFGGISSRRWRQKHPKYVSMGGADVEQYSGGHVETDFAEESAQNHEYLMVRFGATSKYLHNQNLETARFECSFGAMEVYMDGVQLSPDGCVVDVKCTCGAISLYIPRGWKVRSDVNLMLAGIDEEKYRRGELVDENSPVLTLTGSASLAGIEIKYI